MENNKCHICNKDLTSTQEQKKEFLFLSIPEKDKADIYKKYSIYYCQDCANNLSGHIFNNNFFLHSINYNPNAQEKPLSCCACQKEILYFNNQFDISISETLKPNYEYLHLYISWLNKVFLFCKNCANKTFSYSFLKHLIDKENNNNE